MSGTTASDIAQLNAAIAAADALSPNSGTVTIELGGDIALDGTELNALNVASGVTVDLLGNGHTLDGGGTMQGLFVYAGTVDVSNLALDNMLAQGGNGLATGGGGGMGAGGGLFIGANVAGDPGRVTLDNVSFSGDAAVGGNGAGNARSYVNVHGVYNTAGGNMSDATAPGVGSGYLGAWMGAVDGEPTLERIAQFGGGGVADLWGTLLTSAIAVSGGFGGGGGGIAGPGYVALASGGFGGAPGTPNSYGGTGGGGGLGAGGDIFVQQGGLLTIGGSGALNAGTVAGGLSYDYYNQFYDYGQGPAPQAYGGAFGSGIYLQGAGNGLNFAPDGTLAVAGVIADDAGSAAAADAIAAAGYFAQTVADQYYGMPVVEVNYAPGSVGVTVDGTGTLLLSAANTYSGGTTITSGTLEIGAGASAGSGPITFAGFPAEIRYDATFSGTVTLPNAIGGFHFGDTIDLHGLAYVAGGQVTDNGLTLTLASGANVVNIALAGATGGQVVLTPDGVGGTDLTVLPSQSLVTVSTLSQLDAALGAANALTSGTMTIELAANIALNGGVLDAIELAAGATLDLIGNGDTLDGGNTQQGLFVYSGVVDVSDLAIDDMVARGGDGVSGGGGGAGLGGGLFVGSAVAGDAGDVTLTDVSFAGDAAIGGDGTARPASNVYGTTGLGGGISGQNALGIAGSYDAGYGAGGGFVNDSKGFSTTAPGFGGGGAVASAPGYGGGAGSDYGGGGGLGAGGDIFVQSGGILTIAGSGTIDAGNVVGGSSWETPAANAWGNAIYMDGASSGLRFAPTGTQTVAGVITDGEGSTGYGWLGQTGLTLDGAGTLLLSAANSYSGGTTLLAGTLEIGAGGAAGSGAIGFAGAAAALRIDAPIDGSASFANAITGMVAGDALDLRGLHYVAGMSDSYLGGVLSVSGGGDSDALAVSETTAGYFAASDDGAGGTLLTEVQCFLAGTRIATPAGEVAVETLTPGDWVTLADGGAAAVRWVGRHTVARRFSDPQRHWPVRIRAGALDAGLPRRDLLLTPGHALRLGDILMQANALVNGGGIVREIAVPETFVYWHVELHTHALLLAEGVAAESFLDTCQELAFDNRATRPEPAPGGGELPYPRCKSARQLPQGLRDALARRTAGLFRRDAAA